MNLRHTLLLGLISACAAGCSTKTVDRDFKPRAPHADHYGEFHRAMIEGYRTRQIDDAIVRQHTLYAYHFEQDTAVLNDLGMRVVHVLSHHFQDASGSLSVRAEGAPDELYQARLQEVRRRLAEAGVDLNRIKISDSLPGGDGITSDQVVIINERLAENGMAATKDTGSMSSGSTATGAGSQVNTGGYKE